jgi:hypothetical protein
MNSKLNPLPLVIAVAVLLSAAGLVPARIDPLTALRHE